MFSEGMTPLRDREDAGKRLAGMLVGQVFRDPLVLAIPRGGIILGEIIANRLKAELDVVITRKLCAPGRPEIALGAISENNIEYLAPDVDPSADPQIAAYLKKERARQVKEVERRAGLLRAVRPMASVKDRSVIVVDDGMATGSTMVAALRYLRSQHPLELVVAVPVASPASLTAIQPLCEKIYCLYRPEFFTAVGEFYSNFTPVGEEDVVHALVRNYHPKGLPDPRATAMMSLSKSEDEELARAGAGKIIVAVRTAFSRERDGEDCGDLECKRFTARTR